MKSNKNDWEFAASQCRVHNCACGTLIECPVGRKCDKVEWEDWKYAAENDSVVDNELCRVRKVMETLLWWT